VVQKRPANPFISPRLRSLRKEAAMSQEEVANRLSAIHGYNVDRSLISKWETKFHEPELENLLALAKIYDSSAEYILGKTEIAHPNSGYNKITRQSLKEGERILLDIWGDIGDEEKKFFMRQLERARKERGEQNGN